MIFLGFIIAMIATVFIALKLSVYADVLSAKTSLGGLFIGTILLAGATSLPEVTTSISAVMINSPDIAVGNVLGSNLFNLLILACLDLFFRRERVLAYAPVGHRYTVALGLLLSALIILAMTIRLPYAIFGIGLDSALIFLAYVAGMQFISKWSKNNAAIQTEDLSPAAWQEIAAANGLEEHHLSEDNPQLSDSKETPQARETVNHAAQSAISAKRAWFGFGLCAVLIMIFGSLLTVTGDRIAIVTGIGASFIGSFLIAATTSLPEAIASYSAFRLKNYYLALGNLLGSNLFNILILLGTDLIYRPGPLLVHVESAHQFTAAFGVLLHVVVFYALIRKKDISPVRYVFPSILIVVAYLTTTYLMFAN